MMEFQTIHEMYHHLFDTRVNLAAYHRKGGDRWEAVTWRAFGEKVTDFAMGRMAIGMEHRDPVTLVGSTREEGDIADKANLSAGGVTVGCCPSNTPSEVRYVVQHSESRFLIVENREQWAKVVRIRKDLPLVKRTIVVDPDGIEEQDLLSFGQVMEL